MSEWRRIEKSERGRRNVPEGKRIEKGGGYRRRRVRKDQ